MPAGCGNDMFLEEDGLMEMNEQRDGSAGCWEGRE